MIGKWWRSIREGGKFFFDIIASDRIKTNILQAVPFWIASLLTGLVAVGYTKLFGYTEGLLQNILHWHDWTIFFMAPFCFFFGLVCCKNIIAKCPW